MPMLGRLPAKRARQARVPKPECLQTPFQLQKGLADVPRNWCPALWMNQGRENGGWPTAEVPPAIRGPEELSS